MKAINWLGRWFGLEKREAEPSTGDAYLDAMLKGRTMDITRDMAMEIPTVAGCVEFICNMVAMIPIKLYQEKDGRTVEVTDDPRLSLLNDDTKDILNGWQWKSAITADYLLEGRGYAYRNMMRNHLASLHYVPCGQVSTQLGTNPIFKSAYLLVGGQLYQEWEFLKLTKGSKDGVTGRGVVQQNQLMLSIAYSAMCYERTLLKTGGNKRGFLSSENKLDDSTMAALKAGFKKMYSDNECAVVVLNKGIKFEQASSSSVELQLNENKSSNAIELCALFGISHKVLAGDATNEDYQASIRKGVQPVLSALEASLNRDMLLESEKGGYYFACDTRELLKGDTEKRYKAYSEAVKAGWLGKNEIRYMENMRSIKGLDVVSMSLGDVIFDINTQQYFIPNKDAQTIIGKGDE